MKNKYEILGVAILLVGGYYIYKKIQDVKKSADKNNSPEALAQKEIDVNIIYNNNNTRDINVLRTFGADYLNAWSTAINQEKDNFVLDGKKYSTQNGKLLK
jgi:predicted RNA-binding protein with PIN domain